MTEELTDDEVRKFTDVVTDSRFRLLGFSVADLHELRRILNATGLDLPTLALKLRVPQRGGSA